MKFTQVLLDQHIGRMFKYNWFAHGKQIVGNTLSEQALAKRGIVAMDPAELFKKPPLPRLIFPKEDLVVPFIPKGESHPDWKEKPCFSHKDQDLLVQGIDQAQLLTKTLLVKNALPDRIESLVEETNEKLDNRLKRIISSSNIFDAQQEKLPKKKDPSRPAWVFPRDYGITDVRKSRNLSQSMIQLCEFICGPQIAHQRQLVYSGIVRMPLMKNDDLVMFNLTMDMMMMSSKSLTPLGSSENISDLVLPDLYPLSPIISMQKEHIYQDTDLYPVAKTSKWKHLHTLFIYHDSETVKNFTELPVTENQLLARSLIKSFVAAAGHARQIFGNDIKDLPEPVTIQCVQLNSQSFHFSVFQLNTLDTSGTDGTCNLWWSMPQIKLFNKATYENGRPVLEGYNPEVFKRILAFYKNT